MENVLILDTETTGLDPKKEKTIEIGALLYSVTHKVVLQTLSFFLPCDQNPVEHINNIKAEWTKTKYKTNCAFLMLTEMADASTAIIAHNARFDKGFMDMFQEELTGVFHDVPWICTRDDFEWPVRPARMRLQDICQAMQVPYEDAHRALTDCTFLAKCFSKIDDLHPRLEKALTKVGLKSSAA